MYMRMSSTHTHAIVEANMADCKENNEAIKEPEPLVTMKFESPEELSDNKANDETEKLANEKDSETSTSSNSTQNNVSFLDRQSNDTKAKGSVLAASRFGNCFGMNSSKLSNCSSKPKASLLKPSQLNAVTNNAVPSTKTVLQPAKFQNPFSKTNDNEESESSSTNAANKDQDISKKNEKDEKEADEQYNNEQKEKQNEPLKFLALSKSTKENQNSLNSAVGASVSAPSFVFGQNLKERVAVTHDADSSDISDKEDTNKESTNENGSSELMFSNAAVVCRIISKPGLTLSQAAQEMEEANRANKRKYSEVTLLTGEEDETNVLQINCKLFAFDKATSSWQERGRGSLRLNDKDEESRLVCRTAGTQRLVLNTKVWSGMTAERAGPKSLRLTAMDVQGDVRIFVVQAGQKEVEQLHNLLLQRLRRAQERQPKKVASEH